MDFIKLYHFTDFKTKYTINRTGRGGLISRIAAIIPPLVILGLIFTFYTLFITNAVVTAVLKGMQAGVAALIVDLIIDMSSMILK